MAERPDPGHPPRPLAGCAGVGWCVGIVAAAVVGGGDSSSSAGILIPLTIFFGVLATLPLAIVIDLITRSPAQVGARAVGRHVREVRADRVDPHRPPAGDGHPSSRALQSEVRPVPTDEIKAEMEAELGEPIDHAFASLSAEPLAAASIGQTHRATLKEVGPVVVKVNARASRSGSTATPPCSCSSRVRSIAACRRRTASASKRSPLS